MEDKYMELMTNEQIIKDLTKFENVKENYPKMKLIDAKNYFYYLKTLAAMRGLEVEV